MNVLLTGTPGTGKTTLAKSLARESGLKHIDVSEVVKSEKLYESYDKKYETYLIDEKSLTKWLRPHACKGNIILDTHQCSMFPSKWFDLVVVLKVDNTTLYDRLKERNYNDVKLQENMDCEIMEVISEEASEKFDGNKILTLTNTTQEDIKRNLDVILKKVKRNKKKP